MSEPSLICSAPEIANSAQRIALYSHYAVAVAGLAGGGVMLSRIRTQEKLPHILCAVAAFGIGLVALYSQYMYGLYLYKCLEHAANAVVLRSGLWFLWCALMFVGLSQTPGFRFKKMGNLALLPLIGFGAIAAITAAIGNWFSASEMQLVAVPEEALRNYGGALENMKSAASRYSLPLGLPSVFCVLLAVGAYVFSQTGQPDPKLGKLGQNYQERTGVMLTVAALLPILIYSVGTFLISSGEQGVDKAILLFNCAEVLSVFFMLVASMSLVGVPANFPRPKKAKKPNPAAPAETPNVLNQQQAYAQAYAQQLFAQQQAQAAYAAQQQLYAQQQQAYAAAQAAQQQAVPAAGTQVPPQTGAGSVAGTPPPAQQQDPAAVYEQQQAQYYAQQQAYAAYQQQQQAYQQQYAAQQQYAQTQQQVYAQAYQQQQTALRKNQAGAMQQQQPAQPSVAKPRVVQGPKKIGGVRQIRKIR